MSDNEGRIPRDAIDSAKHAFNVWWASNRNRLLTDYSTREIAREAWLHQAGELARHKNADGQAGQEVEPVAFECDGKQWIPVHRRAGEGG